MAENSMDQAYPVGPDPRLKPLEILVGKWEIKVIHPKIPGPVHGWATYEWFPGGKFLLERTGMSDPVFPAGLVLIGYDEATGHYIQHYFDSRGVMRDYYMSLRDNTLTIWRDDPGFSQRFTGVFSADGNTMTVRLEKAQGGANWEHDFDEIFERVQSF
jgi:hypothetical protein